VEAQVHRLLVELKHLQVMVVFLVLQLEKLLGQLLLVVWYMELYPLCKMMTMITAPAVTAAIVVLRQTHVATAQVQAANVRLVTMDINFQIINA
jgi:uncharacterized protein (DUF2132 family)